MKNGKAMLWTAVGLLNGVLVGFDLGAGKPLTDVWVWSGILVLLVWPFIVREEYAATAVHSGLPDSDAR